MTNTQLLKKAIKKGFKLGYADAETSPCLVWTYSLKDVYIPHDSIEIDTQITSFVHMEEGKKPRIKEWDLNRGQAPQNYLMQDRDLLIELAPELNDYDVLIMQNGDAFDVKVVQWRLNEQKLPPLQNLITLDTLKLSRKAFRPSSHKLDYRSRTYGLGGKIKQDMQDCIAVAKGDCKKQNLRVKYNVKDVYDLRKIFWRELDYYTLPKQFIKMLRMYVKDNSPEFCIKCAAKRQKRFDIRKIRKNGSFKYTCNQCNYTWRIKK